MQKAPFKWPQLFAAAGAAITLLAACAIQLRGNPEESTAVASRTSTKSDALDIRLTRCRTVTPEQAEAFEPCRRIWAENRRRFFGHDPSQTRASDERLPDLASKSQLPGGPR
jgi:conjugative transfer region protein TrbK